MYESEVNVRVEPIDEIPPSVLEKFAARSGRISARTVLPWGEHCTECVPPTCYTTCDLYSPREDRKCRRFLDGMVRLDFPQSPGDYLLKIRFKRWAKLWTAGNLGLLDMKDARKRELWDRRIGRALYHIALPSPIKRHALLQRGAYKKNRAKKQRPSEVSADVFLVECYNPNPEEIALTLTIRSFSEGNPPAVFQKLLPMKAGFNQAEVPCSEIMTRVDLSRPFHLELTPNDIADGTALYFGMMEFVKTAGEPALPGKIKCVVWDLDGTLWDGILIEDGAEKLSLKPAIVDIVQELDRRGILQSVASKNSFDEALALLRKFGLDRYFLYPQISWDRAKSAAINSIAEKLNIGLDSVLFVDDSDFELAQVRRYCPGVRTLPAGSYASLTQMKECDVPATAEAAQRSSMYRQEASRRAAAEAFPGDYFEFLRDCQLTAVVEPLTAFNLERVHELTQRTNQMNFSGNRYQRNLLEQMLRSDFLELYVLDCRDRFGSYGIVGFAVVDKREPRITDLMFSCRIYGKRVEHAFLSMLLKKHITQSGKDVFADYRKTPRNSPAGRVFDDLGFEPAGMNDGTALLVFRKDKVVPDDGIVKLILKEAADLSCPR